MLLDDAFRALDCNGSSIELLWASERDGFGHLYVLQANTSNTKMQEAQVVRRLTGPGEFIVEQVVQGTDDELYYSTWERHPTNGWNDTCFVFRWTTTTMLPNQFASRPLPRINIPVS